MNLEKYVYAATVWRVHDGDTITASVDLGFNVSMMMNVRLARINAPELSDKEKGIESKEFVEKRLFTKSVIIKTVKDKKEKYGRYLADVYYDEDEGRKSICINDELVNNGLAIYKSY